MYPPDWPRCPHCGDHAIDGKVTCGRIECAQAEMLAERRAIADLQAAVDFVQENYPLPRCGHGHALRDHGGELLEPSCGCRMPP